jgi:hypothetical protein
MKRLHQRLLAAAAILIAAGIASYWYWSPYLVVRELRNAALNADAESFNEHVDFAKLRASLKSQFSERFGKEIGNRPSGENELERAGNAFGSMLTHALVDKMIDAAVRPETIMFAMREGKFRVERSQTGGEDRSEGERRKPVWSTERKGFDTVIFHVEGDGDGAGKDRMALVMQREGFANWKLTDIRLPD